MARFYSPTDSSYTSQFTPLPSDFMYGQLQQKQAGFDKAKADIAKTKDAFLINSVKGHDWRAKELEDSYNTQVSNLTDSLIESGNVNQTMLVLNKAQRGWDTNTDRRAIEADYLTMQDKIKAWEKVKDKRDWNDPMNPYRSALNEQGELRNTEGGLKRLELGNIYEGEDHQQGMQDAFKNLATSSWKKKGYNIDWGKGMISKGGGSWKGITAKDISDTTNEILQSGFFKDSVGLDMLRKYQAEGITDPDAIYKRAYDEMYKANAQRIHQETEKTSDVGWVPGYGSYGGSDNPLNIPRFDHNDLPGSDDLTDYEAEGKDLLAGMQKGITNQGNIKKKIAELNSLSPSEWMTKYGGSYAWGVNPAEGDINAKIQLEIDAYKKELTGISNSFNKELGKWGFKQSLNPDGTVGKTAVQEFTTWKNEIGFDSSEAAVAALVKQKQRTTQGEYYTSRGTNSTGQTKEEIKDIRVYGMTEDWANKNIKRYDEDGNVVSLDLKGAENLNAYLSKEKLSIKNKRFSAKDRANLLYLSDGTVMVTPLEMLDDVTQDYYSTYADVFDFYYENIRGGESNMLSTPETKINGRLYPTQYIVTPTKKGDSDIEKNITVRYLDYIDQETNKPVFMKFEDGTTEQPISFNVFGQDMLGGGFESSGYTQEIEKTKFE